MVEISEKCPKISDNGLVHLAGLTGLQELDLMSTKITDTGLQILARLKNLQVLILFDTQVTDMGVKNLEMVLPKCNIRANPRKKSPTPTTST